MNDVRQVFAIIGKAPIAGLAKTRLESSLGSEKAQQLYRAFLDDFFSNIDSLSRYDLIHVHATPENEITEELFGSYLCKLSCSSRLTYQSNFSFFERLKEIFQMNEGFIHLTGTDIPDFPFHFLEAIQDLSKLYIGPDRDGGYYYLGANSRYIELFNIDPSIGRVFEQTISKAKDLGVSYEILPEWSDIDDQSDLIYTLKRSSEAVIAQTHRVSRSLLGE